MYELNDAMEIDHPVRITAAAAPQDIPLVRPNGDPLPQVWAPSLTVDTDADGQIIGDGDAAVREQATAAGWDTVEDRGAIRHSSEYVGGALERSILAEPGIYVATTVECLGPDGLEETPAGWAVLRLRHANYPHEDGRLYDCAACEHGPCTCDPTTAACVSIDCTTQED